MPFIVVSGGFKVFLSNQFCSAQLVSAQRLSALFPLRKFGSVAYLNFKCLAWHVCLELLLDKNRYYEIVWYRVFYFIFLRLNCFRKILERHSKKGINGKIAYYPVCLQTSFVSCYFTLCLQPAKNSVGRIICPIFLASCFFSESIEH